MKQKILSVVIGIAVVLIMAAGAGMPVAAQEGTPEATAQHCNPTRQQGTTSPLDPAPLRNSVGTGHILQGTVVGEDCSPVARATVLFWLANEKGQYDEAHRGTVLTDNNGRYKFESNFPGKYGGRPTPHIHVFVWAKGHKGVETEYFPKEGQSEEPGTLDLVLAVDEKHDCKPTPGRSGEQAYTAPQRDSVGEGHILTGKVLSPDCSPVVGAKVILWLASAVGEYDDDHRGMIVTDVRGEYRFESNYPGVYGDVRPHIHLYISASGYWSLETEYLPSKGATEGTFDIVLTPKNK